MDGISAKYARNFQRCNMIWVLKVCISFITCFLFQQVVYLLDQHQVDYDEANSTTYGAATSLRETNETNFNLREYDDNLDNFYRVRIDSVIFWAVFLNSIYTLYRFSFIFWTKIQHIPTFLRAEMVIS